MFFTIENDLEISQTSFQCQHNSSFIHKSLQFNICYFCAHSPVKTGDKSMVQCEVCSKWFHCICIGVSVEHFTNGQTFICCKSPTPQNDFQWGLIHEHIHTHGAGFRLQGSWYSERGENGSDKIRWCFHTLSQQRNIGCYHQFLHLVH